MSFIYLSEQIKQINIIKTTPNRKYLLVCSTNHLNNDLMLQVFDLRNPNSPKLHNKDCPAININQIAMEKGFTEINTQKTNTNGTTSANNTNSFGIPPAGTFVEKQSKDGSRLDQTKEDTTSQFFNQKQPFKVVHMNFSSEANSKYLVLVLNDGENSRLLILDWFSQTPKCEVAYEFPKQLLCRASFNSVDATQLCTIGLNHWRSWVFKDSILKQEKSVIGGVKFDKYRN